jgi:eukaryotic-like serine/threonine-protein kinase
MISPRSSLSPGDVIDGKYRVERVLGVGGMGFVVSARHLELGRAVAIKVLRPELMGDAEQVARFSREARAAVQLTGDHSVRVLDVGKLPSGAPFLVMELLVGRDLEKTVSEGGPLPYPDAVDLILQACEGIAEAHGRGMVHRDVKLANLFLTKRGDGTRVVTVLDFGLVKSSDSERKNLTQSQAVMGSPAYMSPEQLKASRYVTPATDIWSIGVCLHELISGQLPFDAPNIAELMAKVLKEPAPLLSALCPEVPRGLSAVVQRCLEKEPANRFPDVAELAGALEPFATGRSAGAGQRVTGWLFETNPDITELAPSPFVAPTAAAKPTALVDTESTWDSSQRRAKARRRVSALAVGGLAAIAVAVLGRSLVSKQASPGTMQAAPTLPTNAVPVSSAAATASEVASTSSAPRPQDPMVQPTATVTVDAQPGIDSKEPIKTKRVPALPAKKRAAADAGYDPERF